MDLAQLGAHGVAAVAGALQRAEHRVLREGPLQLGDAERQRLLHAAIDVEDVRCWVDVRDWAVVAVVRLLVCDEAVWVLTRMAA